MTIAHISREYDVAPVILNVWTVILIGLIVAFYFQWILPKTKGYGIFYENHVDIRLGKKRFRIKYGEVSTIRVSEPYKMQSWYKWTIKFNDKTKVVIRGIPYGSAMRDFMDKLQAKVEAANGLKRKPTHRKSGTRC